MMNSGCEAHTEDENQRLAALVLGYFFAYGGMSLIGYFEQKHGEWFLGHQKRRSGERLRRLLEGHAHAEKLFLEKVWWPAFGSFEGLHPEYEVYDFRDGVRYLDFAWIEGTLRLAIEIDGYESHVQRMSRNQFSDQWVRQNHLMIDGWRVLRFTYDDVKDRPRRCEQLLQQFMGRVLGSKTGDGELSYVEKEILRQALRQTAGFTPGDTGRWLDVQGQTARKLLHALHEKGYLLVKGSGTKRIRCYMVNPARVSEWL
ncbi:DNA-binding response regulator [Paenibacillus sp. GD4]|uniref:DNA-binding response regulator n=1 Tax=Paenibacillus sp. GD4 TaxID=3068890 RepID=UPI002796D005|nr:DNA-binding response regulator [Paenibacillus sp. GD4]MDQ1909987.1 DNA-binding response regulator [Paenibacillus sp. GD4]